MLRAATLCAIVLFAGCGQSVDSGAADEAAIAAAPVSDIASDETVVFFRTSGWLNEANQEWHLPVHGWIYEPGESIARKAAFEKILDEKFDLTVADESQENFARRLNLLIADNERGKKIVIDIAGSTHELPLSAENGQFETTVVIAAADVVKHSRNGLISFAAVTGGGDSRKFRGEIRLLDTAGLSMISDIDDTVKVSKVGDHRSLLERTFLLDFAAAPGMAALYRDWSTDDTGLHFVSSSPWQLYDPLREFLDRDGFPWASFSLKPVRFRDESLFDLFKKGTETKPAAIATILDRYPERKFVLVGDSGEQDPEVYADLLRERPDQILKIYIRNVTEERADGERFTTVFAGIDAERWQLFADPAALALPGH